MTNDWKETVSSWWKTLQEKHKTGQNAQLRRCHTPEEAALHPETYRLSAMLPNWISIEATATLAGLLSAVKSNSSNGFIKTLATPKDRGSSARMSEMRFRKLVSSHTWDDLYTHMRRAITMSDNTANIADIAQIVIDFQNKQQQTYSKPSQSFAFKISEQYYSFYKDVKN